MIVGFPPFHAKDQKNLEKRIVTGTIMFPKTMNLEAQDLISWLLSTDPDMRPQEFSEIKKHPYFKDIHWGRFAKKLAVPPWIPNLFSCHAPKKFTQIPLNKVFLKQRLLKDTNNASYDKNQSAANSFKKSMVLYDQNSNREERKIVQSFADIPDDTYHLDGKF